MLWGIVTKPVSSGERSNDVALLPQSSTLAFGARPKTHGHNIE